MANSWDLFDTLIGRRCGTATRLFEQMALRLGEPDFVRKRKEAERFFQEKKLEYTLEEIYDVYGDSKLAELEWALELENVFPIVRNINNMRPGDIIVSDMYLGEERCRQLMHKANIHFDGDLLVSCYGKQSGEIWKGLRNRFVSHCGDNQQTDILGPRRFGINTRPAHTEMNNVEKFYRQYSEDLAWWVRRHRLELIADENGADHLNFIQIIFNIPLLYAACNLLDDYMRYFQVGKPLFMSRDTQMMSRMWARLHPILSSEYIYISREVLRSNSINYFKYLNSRLCENTVLVDLAASGGSLKKALPRLNIKEPKLWTLVFLPGFKVNTSGIDLHYVTDNNKTLINNTHLEMLNYADHWHVADVDEKWHPILNEENEYDMNKVISYHAVLGRMILDMPTDTLINAKQMVTNILPWIHAEGNFLRRLFPMHMQFEGRRKKLIEVP